MQKSSTQPSSTADTKIISVHKLLSTQESLIKTELRPTQESSTRPSSTADAEIINAYKLLLMQESLMKTKSLSTQ